VHRLRERLGRCAGLSGLGVRREFGVVRCRGGVSDLRCGEVIAVVAVSEVRGGVDLKP
jgi:hypothetical protein